MIFSGLLYALFISTLGLLGSVNAQQKITQSPPQEPDTNQPSKRWIINKIVARVNGSNILQSDLEQPRIAKEGGTFTLDEAIIEEILYQRSAEMHMLPTSIDIERQLVSFKMHNNLSQLSDQEFEDQLKESGFTLKMYKNQLARLIAIENIKRAEISEKVVVTAQDVQEYYDKHPEYTKEEYLLSVCTLPETRIADSQEALLANNSLVWDNLGWVAKSDMSKEFAPVFAMQKGQLSKPILIDDTHQVVKLIDKKEKRLKTLDERYGAIERMLQDKRKEKFINRFEKDLKEKAEREKSIIYL